MTNPAGAQMIAAEVSPCAPSPRTERAPSTPTRVLIVEDDPQVRAALAESLIVDGFQPEIAVNGAEGIDRLMTGQPPMAIVVDLLMPGVVGQELLEYVRGEQRFAQIPIAVFTASPTLAPPGYHVFSKPSQLPALLRFLHEATASSGT